MTVNLAEFDDYVGCPARAALERSMLPDYLSRQRWFGGKARRLESVRIDDWAAFGRRTCPIALALASVRYADGGTEQYFVPLGVATGTTIAPGVEVPPRDVIGRLESTSGERVVFDALADPAVCQDLLAAIAKKRGFKTTTGRISASRTKAFRAARGPTWESLSVVRGAAEQSNTSILFRPYLIMKVFRRIEPGLNPDLEIGRFLTEQARFDGVPRTAGAIEYVGPGAAPATLAILQQYVPNDGDAWVVTLDDIGRYFDCAHLLTRLEQPADLPPSVPEWHVDPRNSPAGQQVMRLAGTLGECTARMHMALVSDSDAAFRPEPMTPADLTAAVAATRNHLTETLDTLDGMVGNLATPAQQDARTLQQRRGRLFRRLDEFACMPITAAKIRVHGDYHLGQVLYGEHGFVILDFEGEPARPLAERRAKQSPLKDVAGMLRSFDYAAHAALFARAADRPDEFERLEPYARVWQQLTSAAFLQSYRAEAAGAAFLPSDGRQLDALVDYFLLDKACYELRYELNNRPDWVRIPLRGIMSLID